MTLQDIILDVHALKEDLTVYERKYGVLTETFYKAYIAGEEPPKSSWLHDWEQWAGSYELLQERLNAYSHNIQQLTEDRSLSQLIVWTSRHEPIPVAL